MARRQIMENTCSAKRSRLQARIWTLILVFAAFCPSLAAQRLAILTPEKNGPSEKFAAALEEPLSGKLKVLDAALSEAAFRSANPEKPFNLAAAEARIIGEAIGCDYFLLVRSASQRRFSFAKKEYFESFAVVYLASSRTGRLVFWRLASFEGDNLAAAERQLLDSAGGLSAEIAGKIQLAIREEASERSVPAIEELPDAGSPEAGNFRPPLPYRRISPAYTELADLYSVEATIDIEVDLDERGNVLRTFIVRWAGFGLDESVDKTIRRMQWRPAERMGKALPIRVLLRYNFRKPEKE